MPPIPPYEYPSPVARSGPGDTPNVRKTRTVGPEQPGAHVPTPEPPARQPKPFIERQKTPEQPRQIVVMSHPETVTLPPAREVIRQPRSLTPVKEKELTPVKTSAPEEINGNLSDQPQSIKKPLISSQAPTAKKFPKRMQFKGRKGRQRTEAEVIDLLTFVQNRNGAWPNDNYVSDQMRRYYRREYPEYFRKGRKKGSTGKVPTVRPAPINISARRSGTGN